MLPILSNTVVKKVAMAMKCVCVGGGGMRGGGGGYRSTSPSENSKKILKVRSPSAIMIK